MSNSVRAFYALPLAASAIAALGEAQARMQRRALRSRLMPRWTRPEQLHLTLKFLGWVPPDDVAELSSLVSSYALEAAPINTRFSGVVAFGNARRARIIAAAVDDAGGLVQQLFLRLERELEALGIARDERSFRPHVTLARIKRPGDVRDWLSAAELPTDSVELRELVLYRSILGPDGSSYVRLAAAELGGQRGAPPVTP